MCGINGILKFDGVSKKDYRTIKVMCSLMNHRGPDYEDTYNDKQITLGHKRLSIIDLSTDANQPMISDNKNLIIVFNGEIYNYLSLKEDMSKKGINFKTNSDTEVILKLYELEGKKCLKKLRGMFSFGIWNKKKEELFIARDRLGEKPLLYFYDKKKFCFSSEIKSLIKSLNCKLDINLEALHLYLTYNLRHIPEPYTIIKGIKKLEPGHYLIVRKEGVIKKSYWELSYEKKVLSEKEAIKKYKELLKETIKLQEQADVPIAALLSGGVDSSTIVSMIKNKDKLETYSLGFNKKDPELERARIISKLYKTANNEIIFKKEYLKRNKEIIKYYGEPYNLPTGLHSYILCEQISKKYKVVLGGNGADEIFYGYPGSNGLLVLSILEKIVPKIFSKLLLKITPEKYEQVRNGLIILSSERAKQKGNIYRYYGKKLKEQLYKKKILGKLDKFDEGALIDKVTNNCNSKHLIERFYHTGLFLENAHSTTIIADLTGMAHSIEIRSPFLDYKMVEFAASLPINLKVPSFLNKSKNKYLMKKSLEEKLPKEILYAKKMGFGYNIKISELIRNEWKEEIKKVFEEKLPKINLFEEKYLEQVLKEHNKKLKDNSHLIWGLYNFWIWYEEVFIKI